MSEEPPPEPVRKSIVARAAGVLPGVTGWGDARARFKDLVIVFIGVYAAVVLNRFETDRRDTRRRNQILEALEREVSANVDELKSDLTTVETLCGTFDRQLAAGEMPPLSISAVNTGYSASDDATLLQAGGIELLDVQALELLRTVNGQERSLIGLTRDQFELGLVMLANREKEEFYDPTTKQLKPRYAWYPATQHTVLVSAKALLASEEELLTAIRARQNRGDAAHRK